jgi:hypothetical protein
VGEVHASTGERPLAVATGDAIPSPAWIELGEGARLRVDVHRSDRELVFLGPAIVEPCTLGQERASLLEGRFESALAARAPTAEEWIVTPFSVVRYDDAALAVTVASDQTTVELSQGHAAAFGENDAAFSPIAPGARLTWSGAPVDLDGATIAVGSCESEVKGAQALDLEPGSIASVEGARRAHLMARARCAIAALRVAAVSEPSEARARLVLRMNDLMPL